MLDQITNNLTEEFILQARAYSVLIGFNFKGEDVMDGAQLHHVLEERIKSSATIPLSITTECIEWLVATDHLIRLPNGFKRTPNGTLVSDLHYALIYGEEG